MKLKGKNILWVGAAFGASAVAWLGASTIGNRHYFPPAAQLGAASNNLPRVQSWLPAFRVDAEDFSNKQFVLPFRLGSPDGDKFTKQGHSMLPGLLVGDQGMVHVSRVDEGGVPRVVVTGLRLVDDLEEAKKITGDDASLREKELQRRGSETASQSSGQLVSVNSVWTLYNKRLCDGKLYFDAAIDPVKEQNLSYYNFWNSDVSHRRSFHTRLCSVPELLSKDTVMGQTAGGNVPVYSGPTSMWLQTMATNRPLQLFLPGVAFVGVIGAFLTRLSSRTR
ncbi:MAG: hypothetical protein EYC62_09765 [Alphaproteobacteria bacterium]|nr:MAG: hypothetical protein EYC62_09765 [Alphaproteobacteria bacterium]